MPARSLRTTVPLRALIAASSLLLASCGGAAPTPVPPPEPPPTAPVTAAPEPAPAPASEPTAAAPAEPAPASEPDPAAEKPRELKYFQTPEGPRIEIGGVKFVPKVEAVRTQLGIVVKVTVSATASEPRSLLAPKRGALAFAGSVKRAGKSEPETFGDEREGDGEQPLGAGTTVKLTREWPGSVKVPALGNGDVLELDVGLWGLGETASDRRAVRQFFRVKAKVEKWKGSARIEPPPSLKGK
jgi:hypothetical protein